MPNKRNAYKALRQTKKRNAKNMAERADIRTKVKQIRKMIEAQDKKVEQELRTIQQMLDKAGKRNVIHKNSTARKLSRLYASYRKATVKK